MKIRNGPEIDAQNWIFFLRNIRKFWTFNIPAFVFCMKVTNCSGNHFDHFPNISYPISILHKLLVCIHCKQLLFTIVCRDSSVGIATRYRLGGPVIESRWGRNFPQMYRATLWPFHTVGTVSFPGVKRPGRGVLHSPHLAPKLKKE